MMRVHKYPDPAVWPDILRRPTVHETRVQAAVIAILQEVRNSGDKALKDYTARFDGVELEEPAIAPEKLESAGDHLTRELKSAIELAYGNIYRFHDSQRSQDPGILETMPGVSCWWKTMPIERIGIYIPGGTAPLFSSVLMLGIPSQIAGNDRRILCTPPQQDGQVHPAILYCAHLCGISQVFAVGGAQAIAAMAYGTENIPKVDKIFGPGNAYVTHAKKMVQNEGVAIDIPAGPSEVLVYTDGSVPLSFVAADLLSQAEHGPDSQVILITEEPEVVESIPGELKKQLEQLPRGEIARQAMLQSSVILVNKGQVSEVINLYAPEHLILATEKRPAFLSEIRNAGSVFLGPYSPEAAGDYASGPNHTLPTGGYARCMGGVSLDSFVKRMTFQEITRDGLRGIGPAVEEMARNEDLIGHARAVSVRLRTPGND